MKKIILLVITLFTMNSRADKARGGGDPQNIDEAAIRFLIESHNLKDALLNYIKTLRINEISDLKVRESFARIVENNKLIEDISKSHYYTGDHCEDSFSSDVPASTVLNALGDSICFNIKKLTERYQKEGLSEEQLMIRLASLALHEHTHHFQAVADEEEANRLAAYLQITAKLVQVPLLKWEVHVPRVNVVQKDRYTEPKTKELLAKCRANFNARIPELRQRVLESSKRNLRFVIKEIYKINGEHLSDEEIVVDSRVLLERATDEENSAKNVFNSYDGTTRVMAIGVFPTAKVVHNGTPRSYKVSGPVNYFFVPQTFSAVYERNALGDRTIVEPFKCGIYGRRDYETPYVINIETDLKVDTIPKDISDLIEKFLEAETFHLKEESFWHRYYAKKYNQEISSSPFRKYSDDIKDKTGIGLFPESWMSWQSYRRRDLFTDPFFPDKSVVFEGEEIKRSSWGVDWFSSVLN